MTKKRLRRRRFCVKVGVYISIVLGVVAQSTVKRFDAKELIVDLDFGVLSVARIVVALVVATGVYWKIDGKGGDLDGKIEHVGRILTLGFSSGYTLMGFAGIGE